MNSYLRHFSLYKTQESPQAAAKVAALQHFGLYRVKTAFTLLANKTPKWRAENEAELLRDSTEREYDKAHRLEQVGRYLANTGALAGVINAGVRGFEGAPFRGVVPSIVASTLSGALGGGLIGHRDQQVAALAKQKLEGLGIADPLERRMIEERIRPATDGSVSGAVQGGLGGLALSALASVAGNQSHYSRPGRAAAPTSTPPPAWDGSHGDDTHGY